MHSSYIGPSFFSLCWIKPFNFFMYFSKKNIQRQEITSIDSTSSTRWIRRWTCKSMKLIGSSFSNIQTIEAISSRHHGMLAIWISFDVIQHRNANNLDMEHCRFWGKSLFTNPCMSRGYWHCQVNTYEINCVLSHGIKIITNNKIMFLTYELLEGWYGHAVSTPKNGLP